LRLTIQIISDFNTHSSTRVGIIRLRNKVKQQEESTNLTTAKQQQQKSMPYFVYPVFYLFTIP